MTTNGQGKLARAFEERPAPKENLDELYDRFIPQVTASDLQRIEQVLRTAQRVPPSDPINFVRKMNRLFDVCRVRIRTADGTVGRLCCSRRKSGEPYVQLVHCRGGFLKTRLNLVRVSENHNGAHHDKRPAP